MNAKVGNLAKLRTLLKMSSGHFQREAGEQSESGGTRPEFEPGKAGAALVAVRRSRKPIFETTSV
jgi:hypothetical protein